MELEFRKSRRLKAALILIALLGLFAFWGSAVRAEGEVYGLYKTDNRVYECDDQGVMAEYAPEIDKNNVTHLFVADDVTRIGDRAFHNCKDLKEVTMPDSVTQIGDSAFYSTGLEAVIIPAGVTSLGKSAFSECFSLKIATFPNDLTSLGSDAFGGCINLSRVVFCSAKPPSLGLISAFSGIKRTAYIELVGAAAENPDAYLGGWGASGPFKGFIQTKALTDDMIGTIAEETYSGSAITPSRNPYRRRHSGRRLYGHL